LTVELTCTDDLWTWFTSSVSSPQHPIERPGQIAQLIAALQLNPLREIATADHGGRIEHPPEGRVIMR
jgi:hypothetical protein